MFTIKSDSADQTMAIAGSLAKVIEAGIVIRLDGNLGAGKTTFVKGFAKELGLKRPVKSPTYTIVKEYELDNHDFILYHIDAYRLKTVGADDIDMAQFIVDNAVTFVEWAQYVDDYMPEDYILISISPLGESEREMEVKLVGKSERHQQILENWWKELERT